MVLKLKTCTVLAFYSVTDLHNVTRDSKSAFILFSGLVQRQVPAKAAKRWNIPIRDLSGLSQVSVRVFDPPLCRHKSFSAAQGRFILEGFLTWTRVGTVLRLHYSIYSLLVPVLQYGLFCGDYVCTF